MDKQQVNSDSDNVSQQANSDQMLPAVQPQDEGRNNSSVSADPSHGDGSAAEGNGQTIPTARSLVTTPDEAADSDLIEKAWVLKAKQIVEHTAEDPFTQQEELSKMKADYMKKRYNKDIGSA